MSHAPVRYFARSHLPCSGSPAAATTRWARPPICRPDVQTLAVPVFATHTEAYHTETVMTEAVIREFATRTRLRVTPDASADADAVLHGTILKETVEPLTYNSSTQQSSSFLITVVVSVTLTGRDGKVLYENKNYVYRQQYQSTTNLSSFFEESPAAVERLSRELARQLGGRCAGRVLKISIKWRGEDFLRAILCFKGWEVAYQLVLKTRL